jgi:hypothetical protein
VLTIDRKGGREIHRESQRDERGRELARAEASVSYAIGSGVRGVGYVFEREGRLYQSPISWYTQAQKWGLSPGYESHNFHFDRPIESQCLFCHSNRVQPVDLAVNHYKEPVFALGAAIGCERCHGPGELHVRGQEIVDGRDLTIVNPRHLDKVRRAAVCEQCHLLGEQRIGRLGGGEFDYRPGMLPTLAYAVYGRSSDNGIRAVGHVEQMKASRCFRASSGQLGCTSCHDPHQVPAAGDRVSHFRARCLSCHEQKKCSLEESTRRAVDRADSCIKCHMPKLQSTEIAHVSTTDHRIMKRPVPPTADPARRKSGSPLVLRNADPDGPDAVGLGREFAIALAAELPRLSDQPDVGSLRSKVMGMLDQVVHENPEDVLAKRVRAQVLVFSGRRRDAMTALEDVLRISPNYEQALDEFLSYALDLQLANAAMGPAQHAVALNPASAVFHERLAYVLLDRDDWSGALAEARRSLAINPFLRFARMFLVQSLLMGRDSSAAEAEFETLVKLHPSDREYLLNWFAGWQGKYKK